MVWHKCAEEKCQSFKKYGRKPYEKYEENGDKHELAPVIGSMRVQWFENAAVIGTCSSFSTRLTEEAIAAFSDIPTVWIIRLPEAGDTAKVRAEVRRRISDKITW